MNPLLTTPIVASLFKIIETSLDAGVEMSDQPIEVGTNAEPEVKPGSHPIGEGEVGLDDEMPLPLSGSSKLSGGRDGSRNRGDNWVVTIPW